VEIHANPSMSDLGCDDNCGDRRFVMQRTVLVALTARSQNGSSAKSPDKLDI
jgi:hypothetical protein